MGTLYIVSTPIGNLKDITLRGLEILRSADYILCEDTRVTGKLLHEYQISKNMVSFNEFNEQLMVYPNRHSRAIALTNGRESGNPKETRMGSESRIKSSTVSRKGYSLRPNRFGMTGEGVIADLEGGLSVALVSDAGTPLISDPGYKLVREAISQNIKVESIPGPSSVITALTVSGLPPDKFLFLGYLPKKAQKRTALLANLFTILQSMEDSDFRSTFIFFESPFRLVKTLDDIKDIFGDINIVICRELTKMHEEVRREKVSMSIDYFSGIAPKGEFVILI